MNCLEDWKQFNDFIEVSNFGNVRSHGKLVKGEICKNGYRRIHVSDNGNVSKYLVHRLVANVFIPNPNNYPCVNHIDGNKLNCSASNLEWCSYSQNLSHAYRTGLRSADGEQNSQHKLNNSEVIFIRKNYQKGKHGDYNSRSFAKKYGVCPKTILNIVKGKAWRMS